MFERHAKGSLLDYSDATKAKLNEPRLYTEIKGIFGSTIAGVLITRQST